MLCNDLLAIALDPARAEPDSENADLLRRARRFFLQPRLVTSAAEIASPEAVERSAPYLVLPDTLCWFEWRIPDTQKPTGLLLRAVGDNRALAAGWLYGANEHDEPVVINIEFNAEDGGSLLRQNRARPMGEISVGMATWFGGVLALLNTPRLLRTEPFDPSPLNKSRTKKGKPPLLSYSAVELNVDEIERRTGRRFGETGDGVALHRVRGYLRMRRGKAEVVSPHWKGTPERGVRVHHHVVKRAEDDALSAAELHKPGPPPAPQLFTGELPPELAGDPSLQRYLEKPRG